VKLRLERHLVIFLIIDFLICVSIVILVMAKKGWL
jgi:hypothetical protein